MKWHYILLMTSALAATQSAQADPCRITVTDGYLGADASGAPGELGLKARVKTFATEGYIASMGGRPVSGVNVAFQVIFDDNTGPYDLGSAVTDSEGWGFVDLANIYGKDATGFTISVSRDGIEQTKHLSSSQFIQVIAESTDLSSRCDGAILPDVYGSIYFRHPDDSSPILFSDLDDTLFNSSDVVDIIRTSLTGHYTLIDNYVVEATHQYRDAGGVFIGITAQFSTLRPFTRSELLSWEFDQAYSSAEYHYDAEGYDENYLARSLTYLANDDYPAPGNDDYNNDHCAYKVEKLEQLVDGVFGGEWGEVVGLVGDSEHSDGCAARSKGIEWYALMEGNDQVEDTSDPDSYTEIHGGWPVALPIVCNDAGLSCQ